MSKGGDKSFCNAMEARHVRVGWLLSGWADLLATDWEVVSVAQEVGEKRMMIIEMQHGKRTVTSRIEPEETVLRKIYSFSPVQTTPYSV